MQYEFDKAVDRRGNYSMKWDDDAFFHAFAPDLRLDDDTIRMMLADMDYPCAPAITDAMHRVADFATFAYTTPGAAPAFKDSIINWYRRRHKLEVDPEAILYCSGALDGVRHSVRAFSAPGDGVIICRPVYSNFTSVILSEGRVVANCPLIYDGSGHYQMDWDRFEQVCSRSENKVFILCSPANPVGRVWTPQELVQMSAICRRNGVVLVSDEIHCDIVRRGIHHYPVLSVAEDLSNIIMVSGANKSFNLMGLHCAYVVIPDEPLRKAFQESFNPQAPTPFGIAAQIAAYNQSEDWLDAVNEHIDGNLEFAVRFLRERMPLVKAAVPEGTYILWLDFSAYGLPRQKLQELINRKANVALQGGMSHDPEGGEMFQRACIVCARSVLKEALERIATAFDEELGMTGNTAEPNMRESALII